MISVQVHLQELDDRIDAARRLIDAARGSAVSREVRGMAVVLVFAAYENLLTSLTRTLLEAASRLGVGNRRLRPGFRVFAVGGAVDSLRAIGKKKLYSEAIPKLIEAADRGGRACTIDVTAFPSDGSYMKASQIRVWCDLFQVGPPEAALRRIWASIDGVVSDRNGIAHGRLTPEQVGRRYSEQEMLDLLDDWRLDWRAFLLHVEAVARTRDFFRLPR